MSKADNRKIRLSVLDLANIFPGYSAHETIENSIRVARTAEKLGYTRYWFAEHHNAPSLVSTSPALMIARTGAETSFIRLGSGGVMLPNHSPLIVAEDFGVLEAMFPGRIDLGLGRAPGTDQLTALALRLSRERQRAGADEFPQHVSDILNYYKGGFPEDHPFRGIKAIPEPQLVPEVFILGSGTGGVQVAMELGLGFAFAAHINPRGAAPIMQVYRSEYKPGAWQQDPYSILSLIISVAPTEEEARYRAGPAMLMWTKLAFGMYGKNVSEEEAADHAYSPEEARIRDSNEPRFVIGTPEQVAEKLQRIAALCEADEIMVMDMLASPEAREQSLTLLAEAMGVEPLTGVGP